MNAPAKKAPAKATPARDSTPKPHFGRGQPANYSGKPGRSGPPVGNSNALRHGLKAGKLPKDAKHIEYQTNDLRRTLEAAVMAVRGEVTIPDAAAIQTAMKWERHGALCLRWLRIEEDKLKPEQKMNFSREIARASAERDKAIAALKLNVSPLNPWNCAERDLNQRKGEW